MTGINLYIIILLTDMPRNYMATSVYLNLSIADEPFNKSFNDQEDTYNAL